MEPVCVKSRSFDEAGVRDREESWAMTVDERLHVLKVLRERVYGSGHPDVRESERTG